MRPRIHETPISLGARLRPRLPVFDGRDGKVMSPAAKENLLLKLANGQSVTTVAQEFHIRPGTASNLFQRKYGITLSEYRKVYHCPRMLLEVAQEFHALIEKCDGYLVVVVQPKR